jgi:periplasmic protein TonB
MDNNLVLNSSFNELIFERRHKKYGAYQIRRTYRKNVLISALCVSAAILFAFGMMSMGNGKRVPLEQPFEQGPTIMREVDIKPEKPKEDVKKEEKTQVTTPAKGQPQGGEPVVVEKPTVPQLVDTIGSATGKKGGLGSEPQDTTGKPCVDCIPKKPPVDTTIHVFGEKLPECLTCDAFFQRNVKYPERARESSIEGVVWVSFIVDKDGEVRDVKVAKSAHPLLDAEALRVAKQMPKWTPGEDGGKPVNFLYTKPIRFILQR